MDAETAKIVAQVGKRSDELAGKSVDELRTLLDKCFEETRQTLIEAAAIVTRMDQKMAKYPKDILWFVYMARRVAKGEWYVDAVLRFGHDSTFMNKMAKLPVPKQRDLLKLTDHEVRAHVAANPGKAKRKRFADIMEAIFDNGDGTMGIVIGGNRFTLAKLNALAMAEAIIKMCKKKTG